MLLGMFLVWITPAGAFWGLIAGMSSSFLLYLAVKFSWIKASLITLSEPTSDMAANFWRAWWAWLVCFGVTIIVSLFTRKKPREELIGLVRGLSAEDPGQKLPFIKRPEFFALLSLAILIFLNLYFW
jgi:SSS family solute:Na+ symporter